MQRLTKLSIFSLMIFAFLASDAAIAQHRSALEGTWMISGTPDPGAPTGPFFNIVSIDRNGQIINIDPELGAGAGEAFHLRGRKYGIGFFGFINQGGPILRYEVQGTIRLKGAIKLKGKFRTFLEDTDGNSIGSYEGVLEGQRLTPQPY